LATATESEVPVARRDAGMVAVNAEEETNVVGTEPPFSRICDVATKLLPSTLMRVAGDPFAREVGERELIWGVGLPTVKLTEFEAPPPGAGFVTTTE
jgi:hypothetical protein